MRRIAEGVERRRRAAVSSIIGGLLILGIMLTVGYGYFYSVNQAEQTFLNTEIQSNIGSAQHNQEFLIITGTLSGPAIAFVVNNTGISTTLTSFFITDKLTGAVLDFNSGSSSTPAFPYAIRQGQSVEFTTGVLYTSGTSYTIEVVSSRGSTFVGTYPPRQLNTKVIGSLVAAGLGSIAMNFSTFNYYSVSGSGNSWAIAINHPHPAAILPYGVTPAFMLEITNDDPSAGTVTIDSHTELYLYQTCPSGCGGNVPVFAYFIVNVASNGAITSYNKGSFAPITVPYGDSQTLYFASKNDLAIGSFATLQVNAPGNKVGLGEYDVFEIISGSDALATGAILYGQNLPFAGTFLSDNVGWFSETPTSCTHSAATSFSLNITNSQYSANSIDQISLNASGFSNLQASSVKLPQYWSSSITGTVITWSAKNSGGYISPSKSVLIPWNGTAPSTVGIQSIFPLTITWEDGTVLTENAAVGCFIT